MSIVGGLDLHRKQVTFDVLDTDTGQLWRGRVAPANREVFRGWLAQFTGREADLAVEACTGWRFVVEECQAAGIRVHLAEPADVAGLKGRRQHAKTDQADAKHLRELMQSGTLPESWIPPVLVREMRAKVRLYKDLLDERGGWQQRIAAVLYHHGAPARPGVRHGDRGWLDAEPALSPSGRQAITVAWRMIDALDTELLALRAELTAFARRQAGCRELQREYGIGALISVVVWSELGDTRRFHAWRNAVRHTGLDISVYSCDAPALPRAPDPARPGAAALGAI